MTRIVTALVAVASLAPIAFAQEASELESEAFMGMWSLFFESGQGPLDYSLDVKGGKKVAATLNSDFFGESMVTDITKVWDDLTPKWEADNQVSVIDTAASEVVAQNAVGARPRSSENSRLRTVVADQALAPA